MATPSPSTSVASFDARLSPGRRIAHDQFSLETTERRYRASLDLPAGASRDLAAFEYISALEEALHGRQRSETGEVA